MDVGILLAAALAPPLRALLEMLPVPVIITIVSVCGPMVIEFCVNFLLPFCKEVCLPLIERCLASAGKMLAKTAKLVWRSLVISYSTILNGLRRMGKYIRKVGSSAITNGISVIRGEAVEMAISADAELEQFVTQTQQWLLALERMTTQYNSDDTDSSDDDDPQASLAKQAIDARRCLQHEISKYAGEPKTATK